MSQDIQRVQSRLSNIRSVKPILAALRTISLGSWQMALNRRTDLQRYNERLLGLLPALLPKLHKPRRGLKGLYGAKVDSTEARRALAVAIGSERGLCGRYNATILEHVQHYLMRREVSGGEGATDEVQLAVFGSRLERVCQRASLDMVWARPLPVTSLPPFSLARELTTTWLMEYEAYELDAVDVLYNAYDGVGQYHPLTMRLIPPQLPASARVIEGELWPPVIIETDPVHLYTRIIEQWVALKFHLLLLDAAASEHSARFQLMESATQNTEELVEELTQVVQSARREAITREMQELAVGAGLLEDE